MQLKTFFSAASELKTLVGQPASCWWYTLDQILERKSFLWSLLSPSPALLTSFTVFLELWFLNIFLWSGNSSGFIESMSAGRRFQRIWKGLRSNKPIKKACEINMCWELNNVKSCVKYFKSTCHWNRKVGGNEMAVDKFFVLLSIQRCWVYDCLKKWLDKGLNLWTFPNIVLLYWAHIFLNVWELQCVCEAIIVKFSLAH